MNKKNDQLALLEHKAYMLRLGSLRATTAAGSGHLTSALSAADFVAALFFYAMNYDSHNFKNPCNDSFILSKGHASPVLYAAWWQAGVLSEETLLTLRKFDSVLEGHPSVRFDHVAVATGSLGCGLAIGLGQVLAAKHEGFSRFTYVLMGDGECAEGSVWEAAQLASYYNAEHLIAIVDCNGLGQSTATLYGHDLNALGIKFKAFGWNVILCNGNVMSEVVTALDDARECNGKPTVIIGNTSKGYGLSSIQGKNGWHGRTFDGDQLPELEKELVEMFPQAAHYEGKPWHSRYRLEQNHANCMSSFPECVAELPQPLYKESITTRKTSGQALVELGRLCKQVIVIDGETKNSTYTELFEEAFPSRFIQSFIGEQSMVGMACGYATDGFVPFISTFASFFARAHDQLRMAGIGRLPVRVIGSHTGCSVGQDGPAQMALEDISFFRTIPNSVVLVPADGVSAYRCVQLIGQYYGGVSYMRVMRQESYQIYPNNEQFKIGGCKVLRSYPKARGLIVAAGATVHEAIMAADLLKSEGIEVAVIDAYSVKPLDVKTIVTIAQSSHNRIITVEDHYQEGGLGEAVAHAVSNELIAVTVLAVKQLPRSGRAEELRAWLHIDADAIVKAVKKW